MIESMGRAENLEGELSGPRVNEFFPKVERVPNIRVGDLDLGEKIGDGMVVEVCKDNGSERGVLLLPLRQTEPKMLVTQAVALARLGFRSELVLDGDGNIIGLGTDNLGDASVEDAANGHFEGNSGRLMVAGVMASARILHESHRAGIAVHDFKRDSIFVSR